MLPLDDKVMLVKACNILVEVCQKLNELDK